MSQLVIFLFLGTDFVVIHLMILFIDGKTWDTEWWKWAGNVSPGRSFTLRSSTLTKTLEVMRDPDKWSASKILLGQASGGCWGVSPTADLLGLVMAKEPVGHRERWLVGGYLLLGGGGGEQGLLWWSLVNTDWRDVPVGVLSKWYS